MKNKLFKNKTKGFSLVELIVVIAIMAVLAAVLAPALLSYVEKSRAQKDDSAFSEVTNATQLALSDQDVYDELLEYSVSGNKSCYADTAGASLTPSADNATYLKGSAGDTDAQYIFNDSARLEDEKQYTAAGCMRGVTITFTPNNADPKATTFDLANARINEIVKGTPNETGAKTGTRAKTGTLGDNNKEGVLYNALRAVIGDTIKSTSQTYRNSNYTIFIYMGSTGGKQASAQDAIKVYGQWSGTNIAADDTDSETPSGGNQTSPTLASGAVIPTECSYTTSGGAIYSPESENKALPANYKPKDGDIFKDSDYEYHYNQYLDGDWTPYEKQNGWEVSVINNTQELYGKIYSEINGVPVTNMSYTFNGCGSLTIAPEIPNSVTTMKYTFYNCKKLTTAPTIPSGVTNMSHTFDGCGLLTTAPTIPDSVTTMMYTFFKCKSLTGNVEINANPTSFDGCFNFTAKSITITGSCPDATKEALKSGKSNVHYVDSNEVTH